MKPNEEMKCGVCDTPVFERNNYFYGKQLTVRDLVQEQNYLNEKRRLINRTVLGWGVVCGLEVAWNKDHNKFVVGAGLALDCCGREILVCGCVDVPFDDYTAIARDMGARPDYVPHRYVLCLSYRECMAEPVDLPPVSCGCESRSEYNRIREGYQIKLVKWEDTCLAKPRRPVPCPDHVKKPVNPDDPQIVPCTTETLHQYLCGRLKHCPDCECKDCVILGTFEISRPSSDPKNGDAANAPVVTLDPCTYRKFVYRNPLLFSLIDCYHGKAPHIVDFSWRKVVYPDHYATFEQFVALIENGLTVTFDETLDAVTLTPFNFVITFLIQEKGTGAVLVKRIPVQAVDYEQRGPCFIAKIVADPRWVDDELKSPYTQLADGATIEITVRGRVRSTGGKCLDGVFLNVALPTGNSVQGSDFVDYFEVGKRGEQKPPVQKYDKF